MLHISNKARNITARIHDLWLYWHDYGFACV